MPKKTPQTNSKGKGAGVSDSVTPASPPKMKDKKEFLKFIRSNGKVYKLKIGEVIRFDTDISHFYWINGVFAPSVTGILDATMPVPFGLKMFWQTNTKQEADQIFEDAGLLGTKMHDAFEKLLHGLQLNVLKDYPTEREKKILMAFEDWFKAYTPSNFQPEQIVASKKFKYAGTLDFVGKIDGKVWLIDFKTSSGVRLSHKLQVLAYKQAYEESYGIKIDKVAILRLGTLHKGNGKAKEGKLKDTGAGWEIQTADEMNVIVDGKKKTVKLTIKDFMRFYQTYLMLNGGKVPEPAEIAVYPETMQILEPVEKEVKKGDTIKADDELTVDAIETKKGKVEIKLKAKGGKK